MELEYIYCQICGLVDPTKHSPQDITGPTKGDCQKRLDNVAIGIMAGLPSEPPNMLDPTPQRMVPKATHHWHWLTSYSTKNYTIGMALGKSMHDTEEIQTAT